MRIFVTGNKGQLGRALCATLAGHALDGCDLPELDITDRMAIGAAIAQVGGEVERMFSLDTISRNEALDQAKREATRKAIDAGARADTVSIVDIEEVMISYLPGNATRIRVKAAGDLALNSNAIGV